MIELADECKTQELIVAAVDAESQALHKFKADPSIPYNPPRLIELIKTLKPPELSEVYDKTVRFVPKDKSNKIQRRHTVRNVTAGKIFRGGLYELYASLGFRLSTFFESEGSKVVLSKKITDLLLDRLNPNYSERFEAAPNFFTAQRVLSGPRYCPDGLLITHKAVHPVEYALMPDQKYLKNKEEHFRVARKDYPDLLSGSSRIHILKPLDAEGPEYASRKLFTFPEVEYTYDDIQPLYAWVQNEFKPDPEGKTLGELGFDLLWKRRIQKRPKTHYRHLSPFARSPHFIPAYR